MRNLKAVSVGSALLLVLATSLAQATLSSPAPMPGMTGIFPATGKQEKPQIAKGGETFLAVWSDSRSALAPNGSLQVGGGGPYSGQGLGTMNDIYAARLDQSGNVIDQHPIVVSEASYNQGYPQVAWNGENWLVVWYQELENDYHSYQMRGVRVSPSGTVLDATPLVIGLASNDLGSIPASLLFDGSNWVVFWQGFNPSENTRAVFAARITASGAVLDPQGKAIYNHATQYLTDPDVAYNGGGFLLVFHDLAEEAIYGLRLTQDLTQAGTKFEINTFEPSKPTKPQVASNGNGYFVVWDEHPFSGNVGRVTGSRVSSSGQVLNPNGLAIDKNVGVSESFPAVAWNGVSWFVAYSSGYDHVSASYGQQSIYVRRISLAGKKLDATPKRLSNPKFPALFPAIDTGFGDACQVVWHDLRADQDIYGAQVSAQAVPSADVAVSLGAPRQSRPRMAYGAGVYLNVFQREIAGKAQIYGQRLDAAGDALDLQPFQISTGPNQTNRNPSVAFNGTYFFVVWSRSETDEFGNIVSKVFGRRVSVTGSALGAPSFVMDGVTPDVAALGNTFLTVAIRPIGSQIRNVESVRVSGAGVVLGQPELILGNFNFAPRVAAFGERWLVVWEYHSRHDTSTSYTRASFVESDGTPDPSFEVAISDNPLSSGISYDHTPHLAVAGDTALIVWSDNDNNKNDIKGRRIQADGTLLGSNFGFLISKAPGAQFSPAVAWTGNEYIATWLDQRNEQFPNQPRGDIYAARLGPKGAILETFPVANSPAPEETTFVAGANGDAIFAYSAFYDHAPYSAMRVTTRAFTSAP